MDFLGVMSMPEPGSSHAADPPRPNHLVHEVSPYLKQHAYNPVDWYPWGDEAFFRARKEGKPIFLSIGYSTCHWCHVMERESFSDPEVAALLNEHFICIKVDREERPDIDQLYMNACIALTGSGGWPLNMFLTPALHPFYAATYLPKKSRMGMPGLMDILPKLSEFWRENREKAVESAALLARNIASAHDALQGRLVKRSAADQMFGELLSQYDSLHGGFGPAPKFPMPHLHLFLMRYWKWTGSTRALTMSEKTLLSMARGGIYDQLGEGFHRYSTDARWLVPHFEKMLYDQAMAGMAYIEAFLATGNGEFADVARGCMRYILNYLAAPGGGFFSAEDADSEGEEGKYYLWTRAEIDSLLDRDDAKVAFLVFPVSRNGNFVDPFTGGYTGQNILHRTYNQSEAARALKMNREEMGERMERIRSTLLFAREQRIRPFRDEKVLTDWNGLAIAALARVGRGLGSSGFINAAEKAAGFIISRMRMDDGGLYHRSRDGVAGISGLSADYACMITSLLELFIASGTPKYLEEALQLEEYHRDHFWDKKDGGYFSSADYTQDLIFRQKEFRDGAIPSSNSFSFLNLLRLFDLTGEDEYSRRADMLSRIYSHLIDRSPSSYGMFLAVYIPSATPAQRVVVIGKKHDPVFLDMRSLIDNHYLPFTLPLFFDVVESEGILSHIDPSLKGYLQREERTVAYVCTRDSCKRPAYSKKELADILDIGSEYHDSLPSGPGKKTT